MPTTPPSDPDGGRDSDSTSDPDSDSTSNSDSDPDVYPMPLFARLAIDDLDASVEWFDALGFETVFETPAMAHVRYRRYADVLLVRDDPATWTGSAESTAGDGSDRSPRGVGVTLYLTVVDESVDEVAERARAAGVTVRGGPAETGWNTRELTVESPDGYVFVFAEQAEEDQSFEDVMGREF
jgi:catechol 2,3-dioxygenase-like lactoylglutathione lyase family enzyme